MKNECLTNQEKIVVIMEEIKKEIRTKGETRKWKKFYGDVCVRIFREFISKEIPPRYVLSSPNAYIVNFPTEFDLLVVNKDTNPIKYTNMYYPKDVKIGFEIKAHGIFGGRKDLEKYIRNIKDTFDAVKNRYPHIDFGYLTYEEVVFPKRKNSIRYLEETVRILEPYKVFCLRDSRTGKLIDGEWQKFVSFLNSSLQ